MLALTLTDIAWNWFKHIRIVYKIWLAKREIFLRDLSLGKRPKENNAHTVTT